jgi:hypothetical protein
MTGASGTRFGDWSFERKGGLSRMRSTNGLAFAASASGVGSGIAGVDVLGVPDAAMPRDARGQFMRLRFRSQGLFEAEPGAHLALGVCGAWRKGDPSASGDRGAATGRGLVIGNVSLAPNGCSETPIVQIESFHRGGNALLPGTCSPHLTDTRWYVLEFSATRDARIAYSLHDESGNSLAAMDVLDTSGDVPPDLGGWWILHAFSDHHPGRDWCFEIRKLEVGWL